MKRSFWIPALLGAVALYAIFDDAAGLRTWLRLDAELSAKHEGIARIRAEVASLERERDALGSDPAAIERAIREDLEWARPGEVLVRLPRTDRPNTRIP